MSRTNVTIKSILAKRYCKSSGKSRLRCCCTVRSRGNCLYPATVKTKTKNKQKRFTVPHAQTKKRPNPSLHKYFVLK